MGGKGSSKAPSPDPQIGAAALKEAKLGEDWLAFSKDAFAQSEVRQAATDALAATVAQQQLATQERANQWSKEDRDRYKTVFQPMEDRYLKEANNWDSAARQETLASEAKADVLAGSAAAQQANNRSMASMGVSPTSGKFQAIDRASAQQTGLSVAGAQNSARTNVRAQGMAMRADGINMGKGLPSQAAGAAGLGLTAGSAALGSNMAANSQWSQNNQIMGQGIQGAMQGYGQQASILNQQYGNKIQAWSAGQNASAANSAGTASAVGAVAGVGLMVF